MRTHRFAATTLSLLLTGALIFGLFPAEARAASSAEIQKEIDALEAQNAQIQKNTKILRAYT